MFCLPVLALIESHYSAHYDTPGARAQKKESKTERKKLRHVEKDGQQVGNKETGKMCVLRKESLRRRHGGQIRNGKVPGWRERSGERERW